MAPRVFCTDRDGDRDGRDAARAAAVAALRSGGLCALPTETGYGIAAGIGHAARLATLRGDPPSEDAPTLLLADVQDACARGMVGPRALRLASQYWPGPLTLVVRPQPDGLEDVGDTVAIRVPAHPFTSEVLREAGGAWLASPGHRPHASVDLLRTAIGRDPGGGFDIDVAVDDGPSEEIRGPSVVRAADPLFRVVREGPLAAADLLLAAARRVLFVCTGNTCRSPLAEAMARREVATALAVGEDELVARGLALSSAGVAAGPGSPASEGSLAAGAEVGLDLSTHRSQGLDPSALFDAAAVYCLSASHRERILGALPQFEGVVHLLAPDGHDIADPYGGNLEIYRLARDEIHRAVRARSAEIAGLAEPG